MKNLVYLLFIGILYIAPQTSSAQRSPGDIGIGFQVGQPTGLTLKIYKPRTSIDLLAAWDWDKFFFLNIHGVKDKHLNNRGTAHFFYGPGIFVGVRDRAPLDDDIALGISGTFGFDFFIDNVELFIQATPRLELVKSTDFDFGGGGGLRVYF